MGRGRNDRLGRPPAASRTRLRTRPRRRPPPPLLRADTRSTPMRTFTSLIGRNVETESGLSLGKCHDLPRRAQRLAGSKSSHSASAAPATSTDSESGRAHTTRSPGHRSSESRATESSFAIPSDTPLNLGRSRQASRAVQLTETWSARHRRSATDGARHARRRPGRHSGARSPRALDRYRRRRPR